jgi:hypothetical protein
MLDPKILQNVCREVYRQVPQVDGCKPMIKKQSENMKQLAENDTNYLLIFSNKDKKNIPVTTYVRVTIDNQGRILKISTSR